MTEHNGPAGESDSPVTVLKPRRRTATIAAVLTTLLLGGAGMFLTSGNERAGLLFAWIGLTIWSLARGSIGTICCAIALAIGLFLMFEGPRDRLGVVDVHTFFRHPYAQPGIGMSLISGGILIARRLGTAWRACATRGGAWRCGRWAVLCATLLIGGLLISMRIRRPTSDTLINAIAAQADRTPDAAKLQSLFKTIARDYESWGHVEGDASWGYRFGPPLCRGPGGPTARISDSADSPTHGRKLYTVYARRRTPYRNLWFENRIRTVQPTTRPDGSIVPVVESLPPEDLASPIGQVVVKESFEPIANGKASENASSWGMRAAKDGTYYIPGKRGELFIMAFVGTDVAGTDAGWLYGTVTPDGQTVTSAGIIQNCANCHDTAPHGRLFGLPPDLD
jgi:hypothetical protein